jgi:DHA2 family multidrug resistance protein
MIWWGLDTQPMRLERLGRGDWAGIACMAVGLGSLEYVLEEGQRKDWFGDSRIVF